MCFWVRPVKNEIDYVTILLFSIPICKDLKMGFASHATKSLRNNKALLKKRKSYSEVREAYEGYLNGTELKFKELSEFEQKKIRDKIISDAKKERKRQLIASFLSLILLGLLFYGLYLLFMQLLELP